VSGSASGAGWSARVRLVHGREARAYARNHVISVGSQASLRDRDDHPSALEQVAAALGADLLLGLAAQTERLGIAVNAAEVDLTMWLNNPLVHLGVIGEQGHAGIEAISGTLHASTDADEAELQAAWRLACDRSPLYQTFSRSIRLVIDLHLS
jgi:hypothetical protein